MRDKFAENKDRHTDGQEMRATVVKESKSVVWYDLYLYYDDPHLSYY